MVSCFVCVSEALKTNHATLFGLCWIFTQHDRCKFADLLVPFSMFKIFQSNSFIFSQ